MSLPLTEIYCFNDDGYELSWQLGVAYYMQKNNIHSDKAIFTGYLSGLITAIALACNIPIKTIFQLLEDLLTKQNNNSRVDVIWTSITDTLSKKLFQILPRDAYKTATNRLIIPIKYINGKVCWIQEFNNNEEIIAAFTSSCQQSSRPILKFRQNVTSPLKTTPIIGYFMMMIKKNKNKTTTPFVLNTKYPTRIKLNKYIPKCSLTLKTDVSTGVKEAAVYFKHF